MIQLVHYKTTNGVRLALVAPNTNPRRLDVLVMGETKCTHVQASERRYMREIPGYPIDRARRIFTRTARAFNGGTIRGLPRSVRRVLGIGEER